ncbi:MAG: hypothetical protein R3A52_25220 [Polyangiales bacterium]
MAHPDDATNGAPPRLDGDTHATTTVTDDPFDRVHQLRRSAVIAPESVPARPQGAVLLPAALRHRSLSRVAERDIAELLEALTETSRRPPVDARTNTPRRAGALAERLQTLLDTEARLAAALAITQQQRELALSDAHRLVVDHVEDVRYAARRDANVASHHTAALAYAELSARAVRAGIARSREAKKNAKAAPPRRRAAQTRSADRRLASTPPRPRCRARARRQRARRVEVSPAMTRLRARGPRRAALALTLAATFASTRDARGNGRFPTAQMVQVGPGPDASTVVVRTTFGLLRSDDDGAHWAWLCEDLFGYGAQANWDPPFAITRGDDGAALMVGLPAGLARSLDHCTTTRNADVGMTFTADVTSTADGRSLYWVGANGVDANRVFFSSDGGRTFSPRGTAPEGMLILTVEAAPTDPDRVYFTGITTASTQVDYFFRSDDGGRAAPAHRPRPARRPHRVDLCRRPHRPRHGLPPAPSSTSPDAGDPSSAAPRSSCARATAAR